MSESVRLSVNLQRIARELDANLAHSAGSKIGWVLVCEADGIAQYVSNVSRADGIALIEGLLARWRAGRADIPAHMDPDLTRSEQ